jgi:glycosyltransferase involved in cell wall biosynthesis
MYLDTCEIPLLLGGQPPCRFSGIYFRPTFHYKRFENYQSSPKAWVQQIRERAFVHQTIRNPKLHTLFCLDPLVVQSIKQIYPSARAIPLADPVEIPDVSSQETQRLRKKHNISPSRKIFLLFGSIGERKGIYKLLEALSYLSAEICQQLCILIVGQAGDTEQGSIQLQVSKVCQSKPVQIITHFEFISELEVQTYFQLADVILALYQRHVGMSGILLLAAASSTPVLSTNYGLMGELVKRYQLGLSIDSTQPNSIAEGLAQIIESGNINCDFEKMKLFAEENSAIRYAETIFQNIL